MQNDSTHEYVQFCLFSIFIVKYFILFFLISEFNIQISHLVLQSLIAKERLSLPYSFPSEPIAFWFIRFVIVISMSFIHHHFSHCHCNHVVEINVFF